MHIEGNYQREGSYLVADSLTLIIGTRKKPTPHKPKHYLLAKGKGAGAARDLWISSIYPVPDCERIYHFDFAGVHYVLELETDSAARVRKAPGL
jgi:hypothetical protein